MNYYDFPEAKELISKGGYIIKHPLSNRYLVKGDKDVIKKLKSKVDIIVCESENTYREGELESVFEDLIEKYKIDAVFYSFHPLLVNILLITNNAEDLDVDELIAIIISRTSIVRGCISINGETIVPFSREVVMERDKIKEKDTIITEDDILNLVILLNTTNSVEELIEKL